MSEPRGVNRDPVWRMFTLSVPEGHFLRRWQEFAHFNLPEIPVVAHEYWVGPDSNRRYYRVAWVDPYHGHFGVVFNSPNDRSERPEDA